jgi:preprotein translocase subunit SecF
VVYDRVRENLKKFRRMPLPELLDLSVNETLSRTVVTSLSLLITLLALLLLGPSVIFGFTAAITVGIFVGTYSSIFMSTPILIWLKVTGDSFVPTETEVDRQERLARERG